MNKAWHTVVRFTVRHKYHGAFNFSFVARSISSEEESFRYGQGLICKSGSPEIPHALYLCIETWVIMILGVLEFEVFVNSVIVVEACKVRRVSHFKMMREHLQERFHQLEGTTSNTPR